MAGRAGADDCGDAGVVDSDNVAHAACLVHSRCFIDVPVKIDNKLTGEMKTVHLVGGFSRGLHAMEVDGRNAYRPHTSMVVLHDPKSENDQADAKEHFRK